MENVYDKKKLYDFIFPSYIKEFICIASKCPDICCKGWRISIDKKTYLKYKKYAGEDKELKELFRKNISRNRKLNSNSAYARIINYDNNTCPFLNEDKLCKIHSSLGSKYLSCTCDKYPRIYKKINNVIEYSATFSCPEISRIILTNKNSLTFESEKLEFLLHENSINYDDIEFLKKDNLTKKYFFDIQSVVISILQCKSISLEKSMILIGSFSKSINNIQSSKNKNNEDIENIISKYSNIEYLESYSNSLNNISTFYKSHLEIFSEWMKLILYNKDENNKYDNYISEALNSIFNNKFINSEDNNLNLYEKEGIPRYKKFMEEKKYVLENYLVNLFFQSSFPMNESSYSKKRHDIFFSYMYLTIIFIILRTTIIGLLITKENLTEDILVDLIQSFSKKIYHNKSLMEALIKQAKIKDWYSYSASILMLNL